MALEGEEGNYGVEPGGVSNIKKKSSSSNRECFSVTDVFEAPIGAVTSESYEVVCSGEFAYSEPVDTFAGAMDIAKEMEIHSEPGTKISVVRVVDTVIRHFVSK